MREFHNHEFHHSAWEGHRRYRGRLLVCVVMNVALVRHDGRGEVVGVKMRAVEGFQVVDVSGKAVVLR